MDIPFNVLMNYLFHISTDVENENKTTSRILCPTCCFWTLAAMAMEAPS